MLCDVFCLWLYDDLSAAVSTLTWLGVNKVDRQTPMRSITHDEKIKKVLGTSASICNKELTEFMAVAQTGQQMATTFN